VSHIPDLVGVGCVGGDNNGATLDQMVTGGTLTIPKPAATRFYRIGGARTTKINSVTRSGSNIVINYSVR
jgi:hypothetical protein